MMHVLCIGGHLCEQHCCAPNSCSASCAIIVQGPDCLMSCLTVSARSSVKPSDFFQSCSKQLHKAAIICTRVCVRACVCVCVSARGGGGGTSACNGNADESSERWCDDACSASAGSQGKIQHACKCRMQLSTRQNVLCAGDLRLLGCHLQV